MADGRVTVASPCMNVCRLDPTGAVCVGCWRTLDEIGRWQVMSDDERARVMRELTRRAERARQPGVMVV